MSLTQEQIAELRRRLYVPSEDWFPFYPLGLKELDALLSAAEENARLREALEWISYHYENQDMSHVDFRVESARRARAALEPSHD